MSLKNREHRTQFQDISGSTVLAATDDLSATPRTLVAAKAKYAIFIQRIAIHVITDNAAVQSFQDTTPVVIARTKVSPGVGPILFDFGDEGRQLTTGQAFQLKNSAAGLAADVHWEGYMKPISTMVPSEI